MFSKKIFCMFFTKFRLKKILQINVLTDFWIQLKNFKHHHVFSEPSLPRVIAGESESRLQIIVLF